MVPATNFFNCPWITTIRRLSKLAVVLAVVSCFSFACNEDNASTPDSTNHELSGITLGEQIWSATNLDVVRFRNGDLIPEVRSNEEWERAGKEGRPAWCYYANDTVNGKSCGRMYNWYAVNDPRGLSPKGWHVPTNEEWIALETFLGVPEAGTRIKCNRGWNDNGNGDNSTNLCVLPGGYRDRNGNFSGAANSPIYQALAKTNWKIQKITNFLSGAGEFNLKTRV